MLTALTFMICRCVVLLRLAALHQTDMISKAKIFSKVVAGPIVYAYCEIAMLTLALGTA